jgi:hypothetical protein
MYLCAVEVDDRSRLQREAQFVLILVAKVGQHHHQRVFRQLAHDRRRCFREIDLPRRTGRTR